MLDTLFDAMRRIQTQIENILSCDPYLTDFAEIEEAVGEAPQVDRSRLLAICESALESSDTSSVESLRVACAKVLVALVPDSLGTLTSLLSLTEEHAYEVHFSLFCFLDEIPEHDRLKVASDDVLSAVESYLLRIRTDKAMAAWMAGDMLGDHWSRKDEAVRALAGVLERADGSSGKKAALHGMSCMLSDKKLDPAHRTALVSALKEAQQSEGDSEVGREAAWMLADLGENQSTE